MAVIGSSRRTRVAKVVGVLLLAAGALGAPAVAPAAHDRGKGLTDALRWKPCFVEDGVFECAQMRVPLDYDNPRGDQISIAVIRAPATKHHKRLGSIVVNPGGPGGSGVDFLRFAGPSLFTPEVRARFDLVSFDPRGIIRSDPLQCFRSAEQWQPLDLGIAFPITQAEIDAWIGADAYLVQACDKRAGPIIDHMATANVARDMDELRKALGEKKLNYVGYSYGTYLGVTYANLFPDSFRSLVVDGVLDPVAWSTGSGDAGTTPFSTRLHSDLGAQATLEEFFRLCDAGGALCAFGPHSAARFAALADELKAGPMQLTDPETGEVFLYNYSFLIGDSLGAMYYSPGWPDFAGFLVFLEENLTPVSATTAAASLAAPAQRFHGRFPEIPRYSNYVEGGVGVFCADSDNPDSYDAWVSSGVAADATSYFGRLWTWVSSPCAVWHGFDADRYMGPFTATTASPVLVVGNLFDPATPYGGAQKVAGLLPNSRLLTVAGWGHTSGGLSACADEATARYLIDGALPAPGTVCAQDVTPFTEGPAAMNAASPASLAAAYIDAVNYRAMSGR
jgi:pimeloyl-ACP methyl ester carboxylesterase